MKKCFLLIFSLLSAGLCTSQVGVNTKNALGVFHVDTRGDTNIQGANFSDDAIVDSKGNMGIGSFIPQAKMDINGNLRIADAPAIANALALVRDAATGHVGTVVAVAAKAAFIQSTQEQRLSTQAEKDLFNTGAAFQVTWSQADIISNNIISFNDASDEFIINQTGMYELSGFINYVAVCTNPATYPTTVDAGRAGVNVSIQVNRNDGNGWTNFTAACFVFTGTAVNGTAQTIVIPSGVLVFEAKTKIRMIFMRPSSTFGLPHGTMSNNGIALPTGVRFSKGLRILSL